MKMVMAITPPDEADRVLGALVNAGHTATYGDSRGGVLRQAQRTLFIAAEPDKLEQVLSIVRQSCRAPLEAGEEPRDQFSLGPLPVTAEYGGAIVFVWDLEQVETY